MYSIVYSPFIATCSSQLLPSLIFPLYTVTKINQVVSVISEHPKLISSRSHIVIRTLTYAT